MSTESETLRTGHLKWVYVNDVYEKENKKADLMIL